ncbi:MAG: hypothetical protein QM564_07020 [Bergeyella sp.]
MNKTFRLYIILFIIVMAVLAVLQFSKTEMVDWRKNFDTEEKTPFGLYIFNREAQKLLGDTLKKTEQSPYDYYNIHKNEPPKNILMINKIVDGQSAKKILSQVEKGSDFFLISEDIYGEILDSLEIGDLETLNFEDENTLKLTDTKFPKDSLQLDKLPGRSGFRWVGKNIEILGKTSAKDSKNGAHFVKIPYGKGNIYLHSEPLFITNYYLLKKGNEKYAQDVFSYLPKRETIWFTDSGTFHSGSTLRFILANPPLKYAWWLLIGGLIIFVFFNAKRKQRIVPVEEPLKNKSVEFIKSIGNLYLQEGDFHDMMAKKAQYFLHKVRIDLLIDTQKLDEDFIKKLHLKTGKSIEKIAEAVELIKKGSDPYFNVMREDLIKMNTLLDEILN